MEKEKKYCIICGKELNGLQRKFCSANCKAKDHYRQHKSNTSLRQFLRSAERKIELIEYKGGKCEICGYNKNLAVLNFHHIDSSKKSFNIDGRLLANKKMEDLINEANKCMLLCANCHQELHHENHDIETVKQLLEEHQSKKNKREIYVCKDCGKILNIENKTQLCSECYVKHSAERRKVERPSKEELQKLLKENSLSKIGKMFGVSHASIKKWGIQYGIINN